MSSSDPLTRIAAPESAEPVAELGAGEHLGPYRVEGVVGTGGMGRVYQVWDDAVGRHIAVKTLRRRSDAQREQFVLEARVTGQLEHPNIVPVHGLGETDDGAIWFSMPLVEGDTLKELIHDREGPGLLALLQTFIAVCDAVAYAHAQGIIHCDIKPSNVVVGRYGRVYLLDWGIAHRLGGELDPRRADGHLLGTPAYLPPEAVASTPAEPTRSSDVYALGATLYHLLCARPPYRGSTLSMVVAKLGDELVAPSRAAKHGRPIPWELEAVVLKAMAFDPADRYPDATALRDDLTAFLEGKVLAAASYTPSQLLRRWVVAHRGIVATGLVAAVLIVLLAMAFVVRLASEKATADAHLASFRRLADLRHIDQLEDAADALWPPYPARLQAMEDWLARAEPVVERLGEHRTSLARHLDDPGMLTMEESAWLHAHLELLVRRLSTFAHDEGGAVRSVERRRDFAMAVAERSIEEPAAAWAEAVAAVAADQAFHGWTLAPTMGLVPLGPDPVSGRWEFADLVTGEVPHRGPDGSLTLAPEHGVVYVLLPGGPFHPGETRALGTGPVDPFTPASSGDTGRTVLVDPFLIAKHELTQAQWTRLMGANPSLVQPTTAMGPMHPVEYVSAHEAEAALARFAARLPTEAQWEYAARGGTTSPWYTGPSAETLVGAANLAESETWSDGHLTHSPVGSFAPNPYGLHDVLGNVFEWTAPDPDHGGAVWAMRGGAYTLDAYAAQASSRLETGAVTRFRALGIRPVRMPASEQ